MDDEAMRILHKEQIEGSSNTKTK